jgi:hypothetical protein
VSGTDLRLKGKSPFSRLLDLQAYGNVYLHASVYLRAKCPKMVAYASAKLSDCYLLLRKHGSPYSHGLWVGHACFDVSEGEAQQIRAMFEPLGLRIESEMARGIELRSSADAAVHP